MKRTFLVIICLFATVHLFAQKTNFSGTWQIDTVKTDFAGSHAAEWVVPKIIKTDQQSGKLVLTRVTVDRDGQEQKPVVETVAFNGTPFERTTGDAKVTTKINWLNDQSFTISRIGSSTALETWTLEDDGKTLVIDRSVAQADGGKYTIKCYYDKAN